LAAAWRRQNTIVLHELQPESPDDALARRHRQRGKVPEGWRIYHYPPARPVLLLGGNRRPDRQIEVRTQRWSLGVSPAIAMRKLCLALLPVFALPGFAQKFGAAENLGPTIPTPQAVVDRMLEVAQVKPGEMVYDLGSGDGRIVITAAQKFGARAVGV